MHLLSQLDNDATASKRRQQPTPPPRLPRSTDRTTQSDHGQSQAQRWTAMHQHNAEEDTGGGIGAAQPTDDGDAFDPFDPRRAYKYFSNSARPQQQQTQHQQQQPTRGEQPYKSFQAFELVMKHQASPSESQPSTITPSTDYCKRCMGHMRNASTNTIQQQQTPTAVCQYCERRRHNLPIDEDFCLKCSVLLATQTERANGLCANCRRTDLRCGFCQKHIDVCPTCGAVFCLRCHRRQLRNVDEEAEDEGTHPQLAENEENVRPPHKSRPSPPQRPVPVQRAHIGGSYSDDRPIITHARNVPVRHQSPPPPDSDSEHDLPAPIGHLIRRHTDKAPFSINVPQTSIFHPKSRIDAPRLAVSIRHGQAFVDEQASKYTTNYDAFPVPLMPLASTSSTLAGRSERQTSSLPPPSPTRQPRNKAAETTTTTRTSSQPSAAVRKLQQKWEASRCVYLQFK